MSDKVMIEASMLLHRDTANYLLGLVRADAFDAVVSQLLLRKLKNNQDQIINRLSNVLGIQDEDIDIAVTESLAHELDAGGHTYNMPKKPENIWYDGGGRLFDRAMEEEFTHDEEVARILFEEWFFLTSESWLYSKTRRAFDAMVEGGGTAIQYSRRQFDTVVRYSLKKSKDECITPAHRLRAVTKWIAVGGPPIVSIIEPISGALGGSVAGYFLLMDP